MIEMFPKNILINPGEELNLCSTCYIQIYNTFSPGTSSSNINAVFDSTSTVTTISNDTESSDEENLKRKVTLAKLNNILPVLGLSPIYTSKICRESHQQSKMIKLSSELNADIQPLLLDAEENMDKSKLNDEMIFQLREKFRTLDSYSDKIQLLTVLPKSVSAKYVQDLFHTTQHIVRNAKELQLTHGVLSKPGPKVGNRIPAEVQECVIDYYNDDEVSRVMPGKNDCVTVRNETGKNKVQKRLMLNTLKECYEGFKTKYENVSSMKI